MYGLVLKKFKNDVPQPGRKGLAISLFNEVKDVEHGFLYVGASPSSWTKREPSIDDEKKTTMDRMR